GGEVVGHDGLLRWPKEGAIGWTAPAETPPTPLDTGSVGRSGWPVRKCSETRQDDDRGQPGRGMPTPQGRLSPPTWSGWRRRTPAPRTPRRPPVARAGWSRSTPSCPHGPSAAPVARILAGTARP